MIYNTLPTQPEDCHVKIWRYMDLTKFRSILEENCLYFSRYDNFSDKYEGSVSEPYNAMIRNFAHHSIRGYSFSHAPDSLEYKASYNCAISSIIQKDKEYRANMFVSCWYTGEYESEAMWSLYGKTNKSISIKTTYKKLETQLPENTIMGMVRYLDYSSEYTSGNPILRLFEKRRFFDHEREARAIINFVQSEKKDNSNIIFLSKGIKCSIDVQELIEDVYVSPRASEDFTEAVNIILKSNGMKLRAKPSDILDSPLW